MIILTLHTGTMMVSNCKMITTQYIKNEAWLCLDENTVYNWKFIKTVAIKTD
jgi:hypothetical protein